MLAYYYLVFRIYAYLAIEKTIANLNVRKLGAKLFDQGRFIHKDED
jgi:hypothetical protein